MGEKPREEQPDLPGFLNVDKKTGPTVLPVEEVDDDPTDRGVSPRNAKKADLSFLRKIDRRKKAA